MSNAKDPHDPWGPPPETRRQRVARQGLTLLVAVVAFTALALASLAGCAPDDPTVTCNTLGQPTGGCTGYIIHGPVCCTTDQDGTALGCEAEITYLQEGTSGWVSCGEDWRACAVDWRLPVVDYCIGLAP